MTRKIADGSNVAMQTGGITQCIDGADTVCFTVTNTNTSTASPQYYKHSSGYYKCDWTAGTGFSNGQIYTPGAVVGAVSAPIFNLNKPAEVFTTEVEK